VQKKNQKIQHSLRLAGERVLKRSDDRVSQPGDKYKFDTNQTQQSKRLAYLCWAC